MSDGDAFVDGVNEMMRNCNLQSDTKINTELDL